MQRIDCPVSRYDELLQAEDKAQKTLKGLHDKKNVPKHKVNDMTGIQLIAYQ